MVYLMTTIHGLVDVYLEPLFLSKLSFILTRQFDQSSYHCPVAATPSLLPFYSVPSSSDLY